MVYIPLVAAERLLGALLWGGFAACLMEWGGGV